MIFLMQDLKVIKIRKMPTITKHELNLFIIQAQETRRKESINS